MNTTEKKAIVDNILELLIQLTEDGENSAPQTAKTPTADKVEMLTIKESAALISGLSEHTVRQLVKQGKVKSVRTGEVKEKPIYSQEEIAQLLTAINGEDTKYRAFFYLIEYSGFRRSEMLGLEWKNIDFENNIISIKRTSNYTSERGIYTDTTKTKRSKRVLKISPYIMGILKELKDEQDEQALKCGDKWVETDRLYVKWNGRPMNNNTPYFWLKEFCEENNFRFCDIHSLRHFYTSALINKGVDAAAVSGALGHSTITTTTSIYCHVFNQAQARAGDAIASVLDFKKHDTDKGQPEAV